ncbi:unnamed protein product [Camellia sinensis]
MSAIHFSTTTCGFISPADISLATPGAIVVTEDPRHLAHHRRLQLWQETYEFRPGLTPMEPNNEMEFAPAGLVFVLLGKAARDILDAINFYLYLRSSPFTEILDNVPLRNREISSSLLSIYCHARPYTHPF